MKQMSLSSAGFERKTIDGGHLLLNDAEKAALIAAEPGAAKWIRPYLMGDEFINNIGRWYLF